MFFWGASVLVQCLGVPNWNFFKNASVFFWSQGMAYCPVFRNASVFSRAQGMPYCPVFRNCSLCGFELAGADLTGLEKSQFFKLTNFGGSRNGRHILT
jgi:hypothetical protein